MTLAGPHETRKHDRDTDALTLCTRCRERCCVRIKTFRSEQNGEKREGAVDSGEWLLLFSEHFYSAECTTGEVCGLQERACPWAQSCRRGNRAALTMISQGPHLGPYVL